MSVLIFRVFGKMVAGLLLLLVTGTSVAYHSASIFASNNTTTLDLQTAFSRLIGSAQTKLRNSIILILQKNHIEQSHLKDLIGVYEFQGSKSTTADNSLQLTTSPNQDLSEHVIINIAQELATELEQESVAVYLPKPTNHIGMTIVKLSKCHSKIADVIEKLHHDMPPQYSQAFSLRINYPAHTSVDSIVWLGSDIDAEQIKQAFPNAQVAQKMGDAYLVYANGDISIL